MPDGATRVVSLHDTQARPIAKGRLGKPVGFGYKAQLMDNDDGIVVDHKLSWVIRRRAAIGPGDPPGHRADRAGAAGGDRGPRLR